MRHSNHQSRGDSSNMKLQGDEKHECRKTQMSPRNGENLCKIQEAIFKANRVFVRTGRSTRNPWNSRKYRSITFYLRNCRLSGRGIDLGRRSKDNSDLASFNALNRITAHHSPINQQNRIPGGNPSIGRRVKRIPRRSHKPETAGSTPAPAL